MQMQGTDWMVDEQISRARHESRKAMAHFPCLLQARKQPPWIGSRVRRATLTEACRAQGLLPSMVHATDWSLPTGLCRMLGNSMSANVLLSVMTSLINTVRPDTHMQNPWATGRLQHQLRQSAHLEKMRDPEGCVAPSNDGIPDRPSTQHTPGDGQWAHRRGDEQRGDTHVIIARREGAIYE